MGHNLQGTHREMITGYQQPQPKSGFFFYFSPVAGSNETSVIPD